MINLIQGNCLEKMTLIPDASIDLILCDLPYGMTQNKWDSIIPFDLLWNEYLRITKPDSPIVLFGSQPFSSALVMSQPKLFRYEWIWEKNYSTGFLNSKKMPMKAHENILVFYRKAGKYFPQMKTGAKPYSGVTGPQTKNYGHFERVRTDNNGTRFPRSVFKFNRESGKGIHPTQKPTELLEYLIKTYSKENETILDNCMGSGSTGLACKNTNRNFIGIELDKKYFEIAKERIHANHQKLS